MMAEARLQDLVEKMGKARVLVIGDVMLDRFIYGHVERISPESPVPVLSVKREEYMLGGAGNALANLVGLGVSPAILSVVGQDEEGRKVATQLEALTGGEQAGLMADPLRPTTIKTRFLAGHQQLLRTDFERRAPIDRALITAALEKLVVLIKQTDAILISDYGKGFLQPDFLAGIIAQARAAGLPVVVDPKGRDFSIYRGADVITPNKKELSEAAGDLPVNSDEEVCIASAGLIESCGLGAVVATRSGDGMSVVRKNKPPVHLRTTDIEVFDVSGAGDSVIATIAAALAAGGTLDDAAALANIAGSIVVTKVGTAPIRREELLQMLRSDQGDVLVRLGTERHKADRARRGDILSWEEAAEQVRRWKARGLKVGFTNGCFDVLHVGHVSYLNAARDHCDRLIVGLNTDVSVKILKGPERPVHEESARCGVLAALGAVDSVVLFGAAEAGGDNTARALLEILKPDIYFKGGDYTEDQIPEAPVVRAFGGVVQIMPVSEGHSSTASIQKIKGGKAA
ncbi:MAG: D-glycero-beta-D-manno-heptose-7-phosphate kinase [Alphaproteobacteria bacterium]|nr:D-glycero-beta-D-manno-heptose-7-phosphate kinase [Alphaproteobacteria bacterium]